MEIPQPCLKKISDDISGIILNSYLESLSVVPRELREDFVSDEAEIIHYDTILEFVNRNIELTGTQEPLLGPLYWLALRRVASESKFDGGESLTLGKNRRVACPRC